MILHYQAYWDGQEQHNLLDVLSSLNLSMFSGHFVDDAEALLERMFSNRRALVVSNGTAALHIALACLGVGKDDEVIVPAISYAATALAPLYVGATPVFADVRRDTWTLDIDSCERLLSPKTRAIIFVNLFGTSGNLSEFTEWCKERDIKLIQDAAQSLGTCLGGRLVGSEGDATCFSFFETKTVSVGEGGAVLLRQSAPIEVGRRLRHHGMDDATGSRSVSSLGFNYKMSELQAACLVAQLTKLETVSARRRKFGNILRKCLENSVELQSKPENEETCWDKVVFTLGDEQYRKQIERKVYDLPIRRYLNRPLSDEPVFANCPRDDDLAAAKTFCMRHLIVQCSPVFNDEEIRIAGTTLSEDIKACQ